MPPDRAKATHEGVRCILVLDALNQLDDQDHARMLGEHTRPDLMVMSTTGTNVVLRHLDMRLHRANGQGSWIGLNWNNTRQSSFSYRINSSASRTSSKSSFTVPAWPILDVRSSRYRTI